jgi:hypothetical protein
MGLNREALRKKRDELVADGFGPADVNAMRDMILAALSELEPTPVSWQPKVGDTVVDIATGEGGEVKATDDPRQQPSVLVWWHAAQMDCWHRISELRPASIEPGDLVKDSAGKTGVILYPSGTSWWLATGFGGRLVLKSGCVLLMKGRA